MRVQVRLFAVARQLAGSASIGLDLPEAATVCDLRAALAAQVPGLSAAVKYLQFAINADYATDATPIPPDAEIACIPPVSGG